MARNPEEGSQSLEPFEHRWELSILQSLSQKAFRTSKKLAVVCKNIQHITRLEAVTVQSILHLSADGIITSDNL